MQRTTIIATLVAALVLSGCSDDSGGRAAGDAPTTTTAAETSGPQLAIRNFAFVPETIEVTVGTTIRWTNEDDFAHTVTSGSPEEPIGRFDRELGSLGEHGSSGTMATFTAEEPGEISYFCRFHPRMKGTIVVAEEGGA